MTRTSTIRKQPLGKGLSTLLGSEAQSASSEEFSATALSRGHAGAIEVPINTIQPGSQQPRKQFNEETLAELTASIREVGIIQPIVVRPIAQSGDQNHSDTEFCDYEIVAGERRWRAAKRLNMVRVPVVIRSFTDEVALEVGLIENLQRHDLSPMEEAEGFQLMMERFGCTQESLSQKIGKSRSYIANMLRLLNLPLSLQDYVREGRLSAGHARALLVADNPEVLAEEILQQNLNVRDVERQLQQQKAGRGQQSVRKSRSDNKDTEILGLEHMLSSALEAPVKVEVRGEKATLTISCSSLRKLDDVIEKITAES